MEERKEKRGEGKGKGWEGRGEGESKNLQNREDLEFISLRGQFLNKMSFDLF